ncbi:probable alpha-ketoglutarate-dependent hypophosphite dioxygenase [Palaemon carinicauda]|uniref:probable alpha-ketoglutarate-dependent hypophosphite dioxygenase n=1 Tax=Palaemon carinicauda TaxID=392227 RepID=UPI0035B586FF
MKCLTEDQLKAYERDGYTVLDLLTENEVDELSREYDAIFDKQNKEDMEATWSGDWNKQKEKTEVYSIHALQLYSAVFTRLLLHEKILDACEDILGTCNIILHHTKAHKKPPSTGSPFPMHQDYHYFPHEKDSMVAVFISLDEASPENGGLCVYPGSHKLGPQKDCSDNPLTHYVDQTRFPMGNAMPVTLKRGQVLIFSYLLVHGSYNNTSKHDRRMYLMQMYAGDDKPISDQETRPCQTMVLRGERIIANTPVWKPLIQKDILAKKMGVQGAM